MMRRIGVSWWCILTMLLLSGTGLAAKVNFATQSQGATVSAASEHPSYLAIEVIDGDTGAASYNSAWAPQMNASASPWLLIDLGKPRLIDELKIYKQNSPPGPAMATDYTIEVWADGRWETLANISGNLEPVHTLSLGAGKVAERVRFIITSTERGAGVWPFLNEIQIFGEGTPFLRRPAPEAWTKDKVVRLEGFAQPRSTVAFQVNDVPSGTDLLVDETGHFTAFLELSPGRNEVKPVLLDQSGSIIETGTARIVYWQVGTVSGVVTDSSGAPLENVLVAAQGSAIKTYTDSSGAYQLENAPFGNQSLVFVKEGYSSHQVSINVPLASNVNLEPIQLTAVQGSTPVDVNVKLGSTKQAGIKLSWSQSPEAVYYHVYRSELPILSAEQGELVGACLTQTEWLDETVDSGKPYWYAVTAIGQSGLESSGSNVVTGACSYIAGSVIEAAAPFAAISGVAVANPADGSQVSTDLNGQYILPVVKAAEHVRLRFAKAGYVTVQLIAAGEYQDIEMEPLVVPGSMLSVIYTEAFPNPFSPNGDGVRDETTITYVVDQPASSEEQIRVQIEIYNMAGQKVRTLFEGEQASGAYEISWDGKTDSGKSLSSGLYFYRVYVQNQGEPRYPAEQKPIVLIR